ncbi:hypothetical protein [Lonsdalea quercina]|uniref:hypothetical protein n=1 Tax=Lonsdalea quercina TaxID=71657 RepID=UPI0039751F91
MAKFIVRDSSGRVKLDMSKRLTKVLGVTTTTAGSSGSFSVDSASDGNIWFSATPASSASLSRYTALSISLSDGVISWGVSPRPYIIMWGIY